MIIVDERQCLQDELSSKGLEFYDFFQNSKVMNLKAFISLDLTKRSDIVLVDMRTLLNHPDLKENFKVILNTFFGAILFYDSKNQNAIDWIKNETATSSKVLGIYPIPIDQLDFTILTNQLQFVWQLIEEQKKLQKQLTLFSLELDEVLRTAQEEMLKAKKIHETFIPKRNQEIKGISFSNKYLAGEGAGAEFCDLIQTTSKIYQVLVSSQSYLVTSSIMGIISRQKEENFKPQTFIKEALTEVSNIIKSKNKNIDFDLSVLEIDPVSLQLTQHTESKVEYYSQAKGKVQLTRGEVYQMEKGEKFVVFSCGFIFNWSNKSLKKDLEVFLKSENVISLNELMSELFFHLKEGLDREFIRKDSTVMMMEVNRHGIHKI